MSGNIAGRKRTWPWVVLSVLFALTFVWSSTQDGGVWTILRIGSGVALGLSLVLIVLVSIRSRRLRHAQQGDEEAAAEADEEPSVEQVTEEPRTYEEVFGLKDDLDAEGLPDAPEYEAEEGAPISEDDVAPISEDDVAPISEDDVAPTSEDDVQVPHAAVEEQVDQVEEEVDQVDASDTNGGSEDHLQRIREEFRARAEEAALRVKQREAELQEASSVADQER